MEDAGKKSLLSDALKQRKQLSYSREFLLSRECFASPVNIPFKGRKFSDSRMMNDQKMIQSKSFPEIIANLKLDDLSLFDPEKSSYQVEVEDGCTVVKIPRVSHYGSYGTIKVPKREWKKNTCPDSRHFMVMSYNVLAPFYGTEEKFYLTDPKDLDWDTRRRKILDEILFYSPDFVCLQELEASDFATYFLSELQTMGYQGHFQKKKRDHSADGCAIFYQSSRFSLLNVQAFAYHERVPSHVPAFLKKRLSLFSNIALVCVFQNRFAKSLRVRVVTTHLHWDPDYSDIKLLQAAILIEWLESNDTSLPTVIAGDFNSKPGEPVIDYLIRGKVFPPKFQTQQEVVDTELEISRSISPFFFDISEEGVDEAKKHMNIFAIQRQGVKLASAYNGRDLPFTNKTPDFEGVIDHILYSSGTLSVRDVLCDVNLPTKPIIDFNASFASTLVEGSLDLTDDSVLSQDSMDCNSNLEAKSYLATLPSLPSSHFPSDHISLCAWLKWKTVPILSNLARPLCNSPRRTGVGSSKLSQSVPSEMLWKQNYSKPRNTPRKSSLCSSTMDESIVEFQMIESGSFVEQKTKLSGRPIKKN